MVAQATYRWDNRIECQFPFSRNLVDQLKACIPGSHREWVPERKVWIVDSAYAATAIRLMREVFGEVVVEDQRSTYRDPFPPTTPRVDPDCAVLYILPDAPRCVIDAAFKALAREYHPDRLPAGERKQGHEWMVRINTAYERVVDRIAS